jgi:DnaJ-class molecular chaperone
MDGVGEQFICEKCSGTGFIWDAWDDWEDTDRHDCQECGGTGFALPYAASTACSITSMDDLREWQRKEYAT